jgi:hypothetical protein
VKLSRKGYLHPCPCNIQTSMSIILQTHSFDIHSRTNRNPRPMSLSPINVHSQPQHREMTEVSESMSDNATKVRLYPCSSLANQTTSGHSQGPWLPPTLSIRAELQVANQQPSACWTRQSLHPRHSFHFTNFNRHTKCVSRTLSTGLNFYRRRRHIYSDSLATGDRSRATDAAFSTSASHHHRIARRLLDTV